MTTLSQMREAAALLPADSPVHKALIWADMELGDRFDQICELEEEIKSQSDQITGLTEALQKAKTALESVTSQIHGALWQPHIPAVDYSSHINCMAAHGVEPYAKAKRKPKVVTT